MGGLRVGCREMDVIGGLAFVPQMENGARLIRGSNVRGLERVSTCGALA